MSIVEINDLNFRTWEQSQKALVIAEKYSKHITESDNGIELSLWARTWQDIKRYFQIIIYSDTESQMEITNSSEYQDFSKELLSLISDGVVRKTISEVVMSGGGQTTES